MGSAYIRGFLDRGVERKQALTIHLRHNHYPPVHLSFLKSAENAIEAYEDGECDTQIDLPNGLIKTASEIINGLHLEPFLSEIDEY